MIEMLDALFQGFRRRNPMALPEFVLHAESGTVTADDDVEGILFELGEELRARGVPFALVKSSPQDSDLGPRVRALRMVQELGGKSPETGRAPCVEADPWKGGARQYGHYTFPRSKLLSTIEDVVTEQSGQADPAELLRELNSRGWRPTGTHWASRLQEAAKDASKTLPALLIAVVAVLIADRPWYVTLGVVAAVLAAVITLSVLPGRTPVFLGLRREIRWFLGTTYLNQGPRAERGEGRTWRLLHLWQPGSVRQRLGAVVPDIRDSGLLDNAEPTAANEDAQRRHLQLRVHALREDLRDAHSPWAPDLRGRKRPTPPVLMLPGADMDNGRIELIKAISDIRSIRSELDPLLVIAAVRQANVGDLDRSVTARRSAGSFPRSVAELPDWYADWNRSRRVNQSPSLEGSTLPWVLRVPLPDTLLRQPDLGVGSLRRTTLSPGRPRWTWLWSLPALVLLLVAAGLGAGLRDAELGKEYCVGGLGGTNRDSERVPVGDSADTECVGVATGTVTFPVAREVQALIRQANEDIGDSDYVTIVYAGPLSGPTGALVKGAEELRGAYLAQVARNEESPVKLRILVANGGADMYSQQIMARHVVDLAARDTSIVGVVGLGRDMTDSDTVQEMLREAELPVVSSTNSGTFLAQYPNFFGLAATDKWQNDQLALVAQQLSAKPDEERAVVLARDPGRSHDRYTGEQKRFGTRMLEAAGYQVEVLPDYDLQNGKPVLDGQIADICRGGDTPLAVYFAGRSEDVTPLMNGITATPGCDDRPIAVLAGDDLSKAGFATKQSRVAGNVTLYHLTLTALQQSANGSIFYDRLANVPAEAVEDFGLSPSETPRSEKLVDGQTALTHDAVEVLYRAATLDGKPRGRAEAWANLRRTDVNGLATGRVNFTVTHLDGTRDGYAVSLVKVANPGSGDYERTVLCARQSGDTRPLTAKECPVEPIG
ncbi:ABC transporter substrate-binding protein [Streptomyces sp. NPDC006923]|uniref:ABC transporter substrate-binding protein n=1 Tax=Streptomyces sp. NPDC006923 TaxID=3155355 RepID=UPI0033FF5A78